MGEAAHEIARRTDTPLWRVGKSEEEIKRLLAAGFVYQPDDFSNVVVFLASEMSSPLNGEFISRDLHRRGSSKRRSP